MFPIMVKLIQIFSKVIYNILFATKSIWIDKLPVQYLPKCFYLSICLGMIWLYFNVLYLKLVQKELELFSYKFRSIVTHNGFKPNTVVFKEERKGSSEETGYSVRFDITKNF